MPTTLGQRWSMDFVHDQLSNGQAFRVLTVVDNWSRESPLLEVGFRLTGASVVEALSRVGRVTRLPACITVDHGTEFTSRALDAWAWENHVQPDFTRPGKPTDNGLCESFNGRFRDECLNKHEFTSLDHTKQIIEAWRRDHNHQRPHGSLGKLTPSEYAMAHKVRSSEMTEL
ncbi:IS3 family transposase [Cupriavidus basilensis]|uniref:IS3 family transposase n=1 Tax=Cupriavidus basilensis TaxID=68895 RepID=UPI0005BE85F3|nr:IS3 family transposase [Cupriavidus basilensis]